MAGLPALYDSLYYLALLALKILLGSVLVVICIFLLAYSGYL